jgi:arylsulfatase A-like enzyme/Tfp pilus assembly protein PilF
MRATKKLIIVLAAVVTTIAALAVWRLAASHPSGRSVVVSQTLSAYPAVPGIHNVVLISIDTCRADRLSCYGYAKKSTPNVDAVARDGVLFKQALVSVPMTLPSHCSMMTGVYPPVHGVRTNDGYRLLASNVTLAKTLRDAGFQTAAFVAGFPLDARFGLDQGFDTYDGHFDKEGGKHDRRTAEEVTTRGLAWLDAHDKKPFFLFLHYYDAHHPYHPPAPFDKTFADDPYAGGIAYIDSWIGRVVDHLRANGLYDNTLLMIVGDHGESLGEHGELTHSFYVYQATLHVPLIIRAPGLGTKGQEIEQMVNLVDLMPTTLSLLGLAPPKRVDGADLRDRLAGEPWHGAMSTSYFESLEPAVFNCCPLQGVTERRWKYIHAPRPELYDLVTDPNELTNLAAKNAPIVRRLRDLLEDRLEAMKALASQRVTAPGDSSLVDPAASRRLESLGYVGGHVVRPEFDPKSEDPKDFAPIELLLDKAHDFNRNGQWDEAKKICLEIVAQRPKLSLTYTLLGQIATRQYRPEEAIEWFSKAISILNDQRNKSGPLPATMENLEIAAARGELGVALLVAGKFEKADVELRAALAVDPQSADLQYNLGNVCKALEKPAEAIACYEKALEIDPRLVEAQFNLGTVLAASGAQGTDNFPAAESHFRKAIEIDPRNVRALVAYADALAGRGRSDEAMARYREALAIDAKDVDAWNNLGLALAGRGQVDEAIADYRKALVLKSDYAPAHNNLGLALAGRGQFEEAITHYQAAIDLKPDYAEAHNNLGVALAAGHGDFAAAIIHFQKALELKPDYAGARGNLQTARSKLQKEPGS